MLRCSPRRSRPCAGADRVVARRLSAGSPTNEVHRKKHIMPARCVPKPARVVMTSSSASRTADSEIRPQSHLLLNPD